MAERTFFFKKIFKQTWCRTKNEMDYVSNNTVSEKFPSPFRASNRDVFNVSLYCPLWFLYFLIAPLLLLAMGIQLDYALIMIIQVLIFFVLPFLPTPGGSGAAEVGFVSLFSF